jgi:hypothetical protein
MKIMKRLSIISFAVLCILGLVSCDALDVEPKDKMSDTDYFKKETELELFSNPFYDNLLDKSPFDEKSDVLVTAILNEVMVGGNRRQVPASGGGWSWSTLRDINTLLENISRCEDEAAVTIYSALARFFRAYFYFEKVKRFGDVPWYDKQLSSGDEGLYKPRDSRELIMTKMLEDIDYAIANLPAKKTVYRVDRWAAMALKSRFCLFEGTYRKYHNLSLEGHDANFYLRQSAEAAEQLMSSGKFKLYSTGNPSKDYLMLFVLPEANPDEYILAIKFDYVLGLRHNASAFTLLTSQGLPGLTRKFINYYLMSDGTRFTDQPGWEVMPFNKEVENRDPRLAQSIRTPGYTRLNQTQVLPPDLSVAITGYQPIKFVQDPTSNSNNNDRTGSSDVPMPVFRYAEVLLNYAEAKAELGTITQADLDKSVNLLRKRVGMPGMDLAAANANPDPYLSSSKYGYPHVNGSNKGVILEIRRERTIELLQEGLRMSDLYRWREGKAIDQPLTGMYFPGAGEYDLSGDGKTDLILYPKGETKPQEQEGVVIFQIGKDITLSEGTKGYLDYHQHAERNGFNEKRDYLYPIPIDERTLNPNLTQNPGWNDGLDY